MKKILTFLALVGAFTLIPLTPAKAGTVVYDSRPVVHHSSRVVVHYRAAPRVVYYHRWHARPVFYRHRVWGPRFYCGPRRYCW